MFSISLCVVMVVTALTTLTSAAPVQTVQLNAGLPFEVTNTTIDKVPGGNVTIAFTVYNPDPLAANATEVCTGSWATGTRGFETERYTQCGGNGTFAWNMAQFDSIESFVLNIEHRFHDPSVGDPPYNYVTNFGRANLTTSTMNCTGKRRKNCAQIVETVIKAPIYATIAKRR
ncbi:hypothetical protein LTR37_000313 [Vermiconidia calcicola]|uniref:Uncharacterized protein n=1 Tax=Vermiconidia calcicola TaxID=1690605 RepID=A0ACC3NYN5_9PEZI|nr:hypothetical protein LTR37_000313 [Vermiconidia calcicola]